MTASDVSIDNAKHDKLFYFVSNVVVVREHDGRCLILKRDEREKVHPGKYGLTGGKLEHADLDLANPTKLDNGVHTFEDAIFKLNAREVKEEAGIEIKNDIRYVDSKVFVRPDGIPVVLIIFGAPYKNGDVVLEKGGFTDHAWVTAEEVKNYDFMVKVDEEIAKAVEIFGV